MLTIIILSAKYPLAILAKALDVLGVRILVSYDIGCVFQETVTQSSLGVVWLQSSSRCCMNAFHGYTHNYTCQTQNHPNVIKEMGLEDGETLERLFSTSNSLASVTWYASPYHRHVLIDLFYQQWNDEKYGNLSLMLYNNCVQALKIINEESVTLADTMQALGVSRKDLDEWSAEEQHYFATLGQECPWDVHAVVYVEKLQEWCAVHAQWKLHTRSSSMPFHLTTNLFLPSLPLSTTMLRHHTRRGLKQSDITMRSVSALSCSSLLSLKSRWALRDGDNWLITSIWRQLSISLNDDTTVHSNTSSASSFSISSSFTSSIYRKLVSIMTFYYLLSANSMYSISSADSHREVTANPMQSNL